MPETTLSKSRHFQPFDALVLPDVICSTSRRCDLNMSYAYGHTAGSLRNRKDFLLGFGIDYKDLVCAKQVHGSCIRCAKEEDRGRGAFLYTDSLDNTDGFITDKRNLPLAIFTADCLPIFLYDPGRQAIGLIHAGWRSTQANIATKAVGLMQHEFGTSPSDLYVGFGPAIRGCCYEVDKEFKDLFACGLIEKDNRYYLDLAQVNKGQLLSSGVKADRVFDARICTFCQNTQFFSYRKERESCGRMLSVIMLR